MNLTAERWSHDDGATVMTANLEYQLCIAAAVNHGDEVCGRYLINNRERLLPAMIDTAIKQNEDSDLVVSRFIKGVHKRHVNGEVI